MFTKIAISILWIGATAVGLLVIRQHRIDTAHEMADIHRRLQTHDQTIWHLRVRILEQLDSMHINEMAQRFENEQGVQLVTLWYDPCLPPQTLAANPTTSGQP